MRSDYVVSVFCAGTFSRVAPVLLVVPFSSLNRGVTVPRSLNAWQGSASATVQLIWTSVSHSTSSVDHCLGVVAHGVSI